MLKKLFAFSLIILAFAIFSGGALKVSHAQAANPLPAEDIDSEAFRFDLSSVTHQGLEGSTRQSWIRRGINYLFERVIGLMAAVIGTASVLVASYGGFLMLSSAGNENSYENGKNYVKYALIGLVVTLSAYILVNLVQLLIRSIYG